MIIPISRAKSIIGTKINIFVNVALPIKGRPQLSVGFVPNAIINASIIAQIDVMVAPIPVKVQSNLIIPLTDQKSAIAHRLFAIYFHYRFYLVFYILQYISYRNICFYMPILIFKVVAVFIEEFFTCWI